MFFLRRIGYAVLLVLYVGVYLRVLHWKRQPVIRGVRESVDEDRESEPR